MRLHNKATLSALAGVSLLGALAGCTSTAAADSGSTTQPKAPTVTESSPSATPSGTPSDASSGTATTSKYTDGTYSADGSYQSPAGLGKITVKITLKSDVVTAINVDGHATDPTAQAYQSDFDHGIAGHVVGKKIDSLNVTNVSGSSLTSGGFDDALKKIETAARA